MAKIFYGVHSQGVHREHQLSESGFIGFLDLQDFVIQNVFYAPTIIVCINEIYPFPNLPDC